MIEMISKFKVRYTVGLTFKTVSHRYLPVLDFRPQSRT